MKSNTRQIKDLAHLGKIKKSINISWLETPWEVAIWGTLDETWTISNLLFKLASEKHVTKMWISPEKGPNAEFFITAMKVIKISC